ncbi:WSCD family member GA21586-like [Ruditapes philippinarum]|uniref:WSCD family member GA21586-like n=1 Tax=Ruditapes philippinarum TaxID=129788 RepID=UPI00295B28EA|nr:WSCD family member GA21586-like [Ruditapes philippinarum]
MRGNIVILPFVGACAIIYCFITYNTDSVRSCNEDWTELNVNDESALRKVVEVCLENKEGSYTSNCQIPLRYLSVAKPLVALASFPGSGNTWTRTLLETATGILTGSLYSDRGAFDGSKMCPARGKIFVVKTHGRDYVGRKTDCMRLNITRINYSKAIYIIRNPYNALLADFNRVIQTRKHVVNPQIDLAPKEMFNTNVWRTFVRSSAVRWKDMTIYWLRRRDIQVYILVYEKLVENVFLEMIKLANFLNYEILYTNAQCLSSNITKTFKRIKPKWLSKERLFNDKMKKQLNTMIQIVKTTVLKKYNISDTLDSYILPLSK